MDEYMPVERDEEVSVRQEHFTVDQISSLMGLSKEEIERAVFNGDLVAKRAEADIVSIARPDLIDWLNRRGTGI